MQSSTWTTCSPNIHFMKFQLFPMLWIFSADTTCSPNQFRCNNGQCIPNYWKCDTKIDCDDRSDEPNECIKMKSCNEGQFQCKVTQKCIPNDWMCDGDFDCGATDKVTFQIRLTKNEFTLIFNVRLFSRMKIQPNVIQQNCVCRIKVNVKVLCASIRKNFVTTKLIASMTKSITFVVSNFCRFLCVSKVDGDDWQHFQL